MKVLVVYDSVYGNTEQIARAIGGAITGDVKVLRAGEATPTELASLDLLIVGSPTQGGRPTPAVQDFLGKIPEKALKNIKAAAFDTRASTKWVGIFGYASRKIAGNLEGKGVILAAPPEGFFVTSTKGPLKEGETERAAAWAKGLLESQK